MNKFLNIQSQIQNIEIAEYTLKPKYSLNSKSKSSIHRSGFLLKINFKETGEGYSDCFSWEELGDFSLKDQILNLKNNAYNIHLKKSIYFSYIDSLYRVKKQNIFSNLFITKNHFTCTDINLLSSEFVEQLNEQGFLKIKIKCGLDLKNEAQVIKNNSQVLKKLNIKLRLDFNNSCDFEKIFYFLNEIGEFLNLIDFLEDPILFSENDWLHIKTKYPNIKLGLDRIKDNELKNNFINSLSFDYLILKPAIQYFSEENIDPNTSKNILFTSYMDHPLGQLCALYESSLFYAKNKQKINECGLLTHTLYENNCYSETFSVIDTKLIPSNEGYGFGFDKLLSKERWRRLV